MAKFGVPAISILLCALAQAGCASTPPRSAFLPAGLPLPHPTCDTSVEVINMATRFRNYTDHDIAFHLDVDRGPRLDPWYLGYRVHSAAPGERLSLVHNSGHGSEWSRTVVIAPGEVVEFNVPLFGLRPADYLRYFQVELRDSKRRSYWTAPFELCAVSITNCACPPGSVADLGSKDRPQACPAAAAASLASRASNATPVSVGASCE
jgi:hypothetical protein